MKSGLICIFVLSRTSDIYNLKIANRLKTSPFFRLAFYIMEIWKQIKDFPDYLISDYGNVKSLKCGREKILRLCIGGGSYYNITLYKDAIVKTKKIHQLVAEAFLNHQPCKYSSVVNHKNFIRTDNRLENLEIVSVRENTNQKHLRSSSQYTGVSWLEKRKKWISYIRIDNKMKYLGVFVNEIDASNAYQKELLTLKNTI